MESPRPFLSLLHPLKSQHLYSSFLHQTLWFSSCLLGSCNIAQMFWTILLADVTPMAGGRSVTGCCCPPYLQLWFKVKSRLKITLSPSQMSTSILTEWVIQRSKNLLLVRIGLCLHPSVFTFNLCCIGLDTSIHWAFISLSVIGRINTLFRCDQEA